MNRDRLKHVNSVNAIVAMAEADIKTQTGIGLRLLVVGPLPPDSNGMGLAQVVANALGFTMDEFKTHSRRRQFVDLRHIAAFLIRQYYPELTLEQIGPIVGHRDHTTTMNSIKVCRKFIDQKDPTFLPKYEQCLNAVTQWIRDSE
jgi:Bacterial dnaA protein helix-turn-helix